MSAPPLPTPPKPKVEPPTPHSKPTPPTTAAGKWRERPASHPLTSPNTDFRVVQIFAESRSRCQFREKAFWDTLWKGSHDDMERKSLWKSNSEAFHTVLEINTFQLDPTSSAFNHLPLHNVSTNKLKATFNHSHKKCSECCVTMYTSYRGSIPCTFHRRKQRSLLYSLDHKKNKPT